METGEFLSNSPESTQTLGEKIGRVLTAGAVLALTGELGCGKTLFTRGICEGMGVPPRHISSPTFVMVNEYNGRLPVFHLDVYQLNAASDAVELGIVDYLARAKNGVMIIEWAEKIAPVLPENALKVNFYILSDTQRILFFTTSGAGYDGVFKEIKGS